MSDLQDTTIKQFYVVIDDLAGQLTARICDSEREFYRYNATPNRMEALSGPLLNDQEMSAGEYQYRYDGFGRLSERYNRRTGIMQYLEYNRSFEFSPALYKIIRCIKMRVPDDIPFAIGYLV